LEETRRARGGEGEDCQGEGEREEYQPVKESVEEQELFKESELEQVEESLSCDFARCWKTCFLKGRFQAMRRNAICSGWKKKSSLTTTGLARDIFYTRANIWTYGSRRFFGSCHSSASTAQGLGRSRHKKGRWPCPNISALPRTSSLRYWNCPTTKICPNGTRNHTRPERRHDSGFVADLGEMTVRRREQKNSNRLACPYRGGLVTIGTMARRR
jgi:hypothetical protein